MATLCAAVAVTPVAAAARGYYQIQVIGSKYYIIPQYVRIISMSYLDYARVETCGKITVTYLRILFPGVVGDGG